MSHSAADIVNDHYHQIIQKNVAGIVKRYKPDTQTYVILEGPRVSTTGYDKIEKGWIDFCASAMELKTIEWTEGPFTNESETMAWVAGMIRLIVQVREGVVKENIFRTSFILEKSETSGAWCIVHEHVSLTHPDPYGIGDWLQS